MSVVCVENKIYCKVQFSFHNDAYAKSAAPAVNDDTYSTCTVLFSFTLFNAFELSVSIRKKTGIDRGEPA